MAIKRALTIQNILEKQYKLFEFDGVWESAFSKPETSGVWFVWGNSGNGKTSFILQLIKYLTNFDKVLLNSMEEGTTHTLQKGLIQQNMMDVQNSVLVVNENAEKLENRLMCKKSPNIIIIDSFQYFQLTYVQYLKFKEKFPKKLLIFISHADGKFPAGRSAKSVMYDATLKIYVEGYKAFSKGRYIGEKGEYTVWPEKALAYWG